MTKRLPLPTPLPCYFHRASGLGSSPELSALSRGAEPEHHTQHFALRRGAGASSQGQDQLYPPPPAPAPLAPHALYEERLGARGHLRIPPAPYPRWGPVPLPAPGTQRGLRAGGSWRLLSRLFPGTTLRTLPPPAAPGPWCCKKKNIPLTSVRLCDPPSVPGPFPLSCFPPPPVVCCQDQRGTEVPGGAGVAPLWCHPRWPPRAGDPLRRPDPPSTSPVLGAGAAPCPCRGWRGGRAGFGLESCCCRVFTAPRGEMQGCPPLQLLGSGAMGRCSGGLRQRGPPLNSSHKCYYAKAAAESSAWREAMRPELGSARGLPSPRRRGLKGGRYSPGGRGAAPRGFTPLPCTRERGSDFGRGGSREPPPSEVGSTG